MAPMALEELLGLALPDLVARAGAVRDASWGRRITYSPKVFIPLTMLCRDRCGYCTFAKAPARVAAPYLSPEQVLALARAGAAAGCAEALFTLGEQPEDRYPAAAEWLSDQGYRSTVDYLVAMCRLVVEETGLLPHANAGALPGEELAALRAATASQGMMIESLRADLDCHRGAPDKTPERRLATLEAAGSLAIPFTTGILVGIGETRADRLAALEAIADSHRRHGHVQEVIVQNFLPKAGTAMHAGAAVPRGGVPAGRSRSPDWSCPPESRSRPLPTCPTTSRRCWPPVSATGAGCRRSTVDHVNPERPWPALDRLQEVTEEAGFGLAPRLTIYPRYAAEPERWLDPAMRFPVLDRSDAECLAREPGQEWYSGAESAPPLLLPPPALRRPPELSGAVAEVLGGVLLGQEPGVDELTTLFGARGQEVVAVAEVADCLRQEAVGDVITWVSNRNINYTNVCTFKCRFCAFSKGPLSLNLRGTPYLLGLDEITRRVVEAEALGATEVCLQGGIHPSFDGDYYLEVIRAVREASETIHIHGFTALEVHEGARRLGEPLAKYLQRLMDAGLKTLPGTAAEILDDEIRAVLCPDKIDTETWLEVHRTAHSLGLRSNITIMFGAVEQPVHWARHLVRTRALQKETGGFTEFVPLPFVHMASPIYLQRRSRRGPTYREALLMHAVGRIAYHGWVPNIQASWVKMGLDGVSQLLRAGVNDLGGTLMDENISRAAGARHGQMLDEEALRSLADSLGRRLEQRTTLYGRVAPAS